MELEVNLDFYTYDSFREEMQKIVHGALENSFSGKIMIYFRCDSVEQDFQIFKIEIGVNMEYENLKLYYGVYKTNYYNEHHYTKKIDNEHILEHVFEILCRGRLCLECYQILLDQERCMNCHFHKLREEFRLAKGYIEKMETCPICLANVYNNRLDCGHKIHYRCCLDFNPHKWYDEENTFKIICPMCRKEFTKRDYNMIFN